jgi:hypothetical protein
MREPQTRNLDLIGRKPVKHEGVVGIRAVRDGDFAGADGGEARHLCFSVKVVNSERISRVRLEPANREPLPPRTGS